MENTSPHTDSASASASASGAGSGARASSGAGAGVGAGAGTGSGAVPGFAPGAGSARGTGARSKPRTSGVVDALVELCRNIHMAGYIPNLSLLKLRSPNHSNRDYVRALEIFQDELGELDRSSSDIPDDCRHYCDATIKRMWSVLEMKSNERVRQAEESCKINVEEARHSRMLMENELEELKKEAEVSSQAIAKLKAELEQSHGREEEYKARLQQANAELNSSRSQLEVMQKNYSALADKVGQIVQQTAQKTS